MIPFKGSMPAPMYEHGRIQLEGKTYYISHREWLESFKSWQYTLTIDKDCTMIFLLEQDITRKQD